MPPATEERNHLGQSCVEGAQLAWEMPWVGVWELRALHSGGGSDPGVRIPPVRLRQAQGVFLGWLEDKGRGLEQSAFKKEALGLM